MSSLLCACGTPLAWHEGIYYCSFCPLQAPGVFTELVWELADEPDTTPREKICRDCEAVLTKTYFWCDHECYLRWVTKGHYTERV